MFNGKDIVLVIDDAQEILRSPLPSVSEHFMNVLNSFRELKSAAPGDGGYCTLRSIILLTDQNFPSLPFVSIEVPALSPNSILDLLKHVESSPPIMLNDSATLSGLKCVADDIFARTFGHPEHVAFCVSAMHKNFSDHGMFLEHFHQSQNKKYEIDKSIINASWTELWSGELLQLMMRSCSSVHRLIDEIPRDATSRELQIQFIASGNALIVPDGHVQRSNVDFLVALGALRKIAPSEFAISSPFVRSVLLLEAAKKKEQSPKSKLRKKSFEFPIDPIYELIAEILTDKAFPSRSFVRTGNDLDLNSHFGLFVAIYDDISQRVVNSLRSSRVVIHPEFIPQTLSPTLLSAANEDRNYDASVMLAPVAGLIDEDVDDDNEEEEIDDDEEQDEEKVKTKNLAEQTVDVLPLVESNSPDYFHNQFRVLQETSCRTVIVLNQTHSPFFNTRPSEAGALSKTLVEIAILPLRPAGNMQQYEHDEEKIRIMQETLLVHKRASGATDAWLILFRGSGSLTEVFIPSLFESSESSSGITTVLCN